jgi:hypothetical protein
MALKEGRCPNCGSILHLDPTAEKGHCLFCDAVFDNQEAFDIAANPKDVVFPNLPQPKYEGPSLSPRQSSAAVTQAPRKQQAAPKKPVETKPAYVMKEPVKMPDFKLSHKTKLIILIAVVLVVAIAAAIAVPTIISRDAARSKLLASLPGMASFTVNTDQNVTIGRTNNSYLLIVAAENVTQADAVSLFKAYSEKLAAVQNLDSAEGIHRQVTLKLVMPDGGWLIDRPDLDELDSGAAVQPLKP